MPLEALGDETGQILPAPGGSHAGAHLALHAQCALDPQGRPSDLRGRPVAGGREALEQERRHDGAGPGAR